MCRSAHKRTTCTAESGRLQYHLTAIKITSGANGTQKIVKLSVS